MATVPKMPPDEGLDILRRLEPMLASVNERLKAIEAEQRRHGESAAELRGRLNELSSKVPTIWQIVAAVLGINAGIMALGLGMAKIIAP